MQPDDIICIFEKHLVLAESSEKYTKRCRASIEKDSLPVVEREGILAWLDSRPALAMLPGGSKPLFLGNLDSTPIDGEYFTSEDVIAYAKQLYAEPSE